MGLGAADQGAEPGLSGLERLSHRDVRCDDVDILMLTQGFWA